jgi:serine/threonine protein kinase
MAALDHPGIVRILDAGEADGQAYLAMELLRGVTLARLLADRQRLGPAAVRSLLEAVCSALAAMHRRGIVHRDITASNLLVTEPAAASSPDGAGLGERVTLMDLGLARARGMVTVTGTASIVGTLAYMAPERLRGAPADERSDVYSLGVVAYECLTGHRPFRAEGEPDLIRRLMVGSPVLPRPLDPETPPALAATVLQMIAADPDRRPANAEAVLAGLTAGPLPDTPRRQVPGPGHRTGPDPDGAPLVQELDPERASWRQLLDQARTAHQGGRDTEAQVLALHCTRRLRREVETSGTDPDPGPQAVEALLAELRELTSGSRPRPVPGPCPARPAACEVSERGPGGEGGTA